MEMAFASSTSSRGSPRSSRPVQTSSTIHRISLFVVASFALCALTAGASAAVDSCTFTSRTYSVGDVWYPRLGQRGALYCVACVCQEGGKINCTIHQCGQECSSPQTSNECCVYCSKPKGGAALGGHTLATLTTAPNRPSNLLTNNSAATASTVGSSVTAGTIPEAAGGETPTTCLHNGNVYRHKERFTSSSIGLKPEHPNQCVQCACEAGMVLCQLRDCPKPECENPIRTRDDCCPVCPDPAGRLDEMDNSPVVIQQPESSGKMEDCISGGRYYLHGTTWHPVMGPFGPMDCVICECKSGRIECHRLECPSRQVLNCDRPVKVAGRCCPVCPLEADNSGPVSPSSTVTRDASRSSAHSAVRPMRTNATHSRSSATSTPSGKASSSSRPGTSLCLPSDHDVVVYRAQGGGNASEYIQYIFQKVGNAIEHHMWVFQPTETTYKVQDLTKDQADAMRQRFRFSVLGATMSKNVKRFTKREKKLKTKCLPASGCPKKIRRLERNLVLKEVTNRRGCLPTEVDAS